ncbi:MAG: FtsX-like permease family protein [Bacteroidales bacterium]|nr:FtsX-like permease family protein [Bacteroidales bacterium]
MFKNYIKTAIRNSFKSGTTSLINFLGLTVGLVCSFLIFLYVNHEINYDKFHEKSERIFRVLSIDEALGISSNFVGITIPGLAPGMKREIPEVENIVRIRNSGRALVEYNKRVLYSENLIYSEPSFLEVFDFELKVGDRKTCLVDPNTAILTESAAKKIFGDEDPIGKIFSADGTDNLQVSGILADQKFPSHIQLDIIVSMTPEPNDTATIDYYDSWNNISMVEYALLRTSDDANKVIPEMDSLLRRNDVRPAWKATLQPLDEIHLHSEEILFDVLNYEKGNINYVKSLSLIAIIIVLIACFNYMNLSTAQSAKRAKEIGVRKTIGARKNQLIIQHLFEAITQVALSIVVGLGIIELINNNYSIIDTSIYSFFVSTPIFIFILIALTIILGIFSGLYPALILSAFKPQVILKGKFISGKKGLWLRRSLVILQFVATFVMIVGTIVVVNQLRYTLSKDKGFNTDQIVNLRLSSRELYDSYDALKIELEKIPGVEMIASSGSMPGLGYGRTGIIPEGASEEDDWIVSTVSVDENYIPLLGMEITEGKNFYENISNEPIPIIVNEALVNSIGWENGVDKIIDLGNDRKAQIIGVVKDFHFTTMRHKIEPIMIRYRAGANRVISINVNANSIPETLNAIEQQWSIMNEGVPFEYEFFDDRFQELFEKEQDFSRMFFRFTLLSIFVAILGLFGLAAFSAEQRTKEIGIRKTFGATIKQMIVLQSHEYTKLVLIAIVFATPISIFIMKKWLQGFEYRIELDATPFILSAALVFVVTIFTVSIQAYKAARKNPAETLKYE